MKSEQFVTVTPEGTKKLAKLLAQNLKGDEVLALTGDLGSGKTTFVQGLGEALGIDQQITSPTYVIHQRYGTEDGNHLSHFDFYRIESGDLRGLEFHNLLGQEIVVIEWADKVESELPEGAIWIDLQVQDEESRGITFRFNESQKYITENLKDCNC